VKDYTLIGTDSNGKEITLADVKNNRNRLAVHPVANSLLSRFKLVIRAVHSPGKEARVCEVRAVKSV
jgi:hypothetical protein